MSENTTNNKNVRNDEIDLLDLLKRIGRTVNKWANASGRGILISIVFMLRNWVWLSTSVILGILISVAISFNSPKIFSSEITIRSNTVPNSDMINYINRLHSYSLQGDSYSLATALSITTENADNINDIQAFWAIDLANDGVPDIVDYKDNYDVTDTINVRMKDRFVIRVRLNDSQEFAPLTEKIIGYAGQNTLFQQRNTVRLAQRKEIRERLIYDINQLDSLQKVKYFEETRNRIPSSGGQMVFLQQQTTQLIYSDIYTLYSRKQTIDTELELYNDIVTLLTDFIQPRKPINGLFDYSKRYIPILFMLTLLILILVENKGRISETFRKY